MIKNTPQPTNTPVYLLFDQFDNSDPEWTLQEFSRIEGSTLVVDRTFDGPRQLASRRDVSIASSCFQFSTLAIVEELDGEFPDNFGVNVEFWLPSSGGSQDVVYFIFQTGGGAWIRVQPNNAFDPDKDTVAFYPSFDVGDPVEIEIIYNNGELSVLLNGRELQYDPDWDTIYSTEDSSLENISRIGLGTANLATTGNERMVVAFENVSIEACN